MVLGVHLQREGLLLLVAQDGDLHRLALVGAQGAVPAGEIRDWLRAHLEDDVEGFEAGGGGFALARHLLDHQAVGHAQVLGHLRGERLNQRAHIQAAAEERHVEPAA